MVLVERNAENVRNGRRSRGPSPNGHGVAAGVIGGGVSGGVSPDSSSDDDSTKKTGNKTGKTKSDYEEKIRVGRDYQAVCPDLIPSADRKPESLNDRALLVWSPTKEIPDLKLEEYISVAKEKYGYNGEQALGMLFWHKHDLERAVLDLANFTPFPDEWTAEDKVLFEQAFQFHGKSFHRIRQMLPDKSIASLVKFYYSWKKTRSRTSVMDRQEKIKSKEGSENGSEENGSNEESDSEEKKWPLYRGIRRASGSPPRANNNDEQTSSSPPTNQAASNGEKEPKTIKEPNSSGDTKAFTSNSTNSCFGCGVSCNYTNLSPHGALCNSCFHHWRRTGSLRPTSGPCFGKRSRGGGSNSNDRHKRKPPRGMHINHDDIVALACPENDQNKNRNDDLLASMDREMSSLLTQIQQNKQIVSTLKRKNSDASSDDLRPSDAGNRINSRWNNDELLLAVKGVRKFGKDFRSIAETIATKSESQVRTFFVNYRRRYNLDTMLKEFEMNNQQKRSDDKSSSLLLNKVHEPEILEIDLDDEPTSNGKDDIIMEDISMPIKATTPPIQPQAIPPATSPTTIVPITTATSTIAVSTTITTTSTANSVNVKPSTKTDDETEIISLTDK